MVRTGVGATAQPATLAELTAAAGATGLVFRDVLCGGGLTTEFMLTLHADGSATSQDINQPPENLSAAQIAAAFDAAGYLFGDSQVLLRAYKNTTSGVTRYSLALEGKPLAGATFSTYPPALLATQ
jgi:hypothetical protein